MVETVDTTLNDEKVLEIIDTDTFLPEDLLVTAKQLLDETAGPYSCVRHNTHQD